MSDHSYPRYSYQVLPREVDLTKRVTIITLGDYILHAAGEDADRIGFGVNHLQEVGNSTWVLSRMAIEVDRFPAEYERYTIGTWVGEINRLTTTRNFILHDAQGRQFATATTQWAMIDMQSRHPLDLRENVNYAAALIPEPCPMDRPAKIARIEGEEVETHRVRYSDIDFNQHTNTMKYIQWMVDTLPLEYLTERGLRRLDINFLHETRYGQQVVLHRASTDSADHFEGVLLPDQTPVCRALFTWCK
ncbi:MAG: thioesterase [Alistipes sp.]|nr:thioesterase [Alistipes sp.]